MLYILQISTLLILFVFCTLYMKRDIDLQQLITSHLKNIFTKDYSFIFYYSLSLILLLLPRNINIKKNIINATQQRQSKIITRKMKKNVYQQSEKFKWISSVNNRGKGMNKKTIIKQIIYSDIYEYEHKYIQQHHCQLTNIWFVFYYKRNYNSRVHSL